jgi:CSLREA domain-containing protein
MLAGLACTLTDLVEAADIPNLIVTKQSDTDDGACTEEDCSLREAVLAANASPEADTIFVPAGLYVLTLHGEGDAHHGSLDLTGDVIIIGVDPAATVVDGDDVDRVFVVESGAAEIRSLTVRKGRVPEPTEGGGGVLVQAGAALILEDVQLLDNRAEWDTTVPGMNLRGGGIRNHGTLSILGGRIAGNRSRGGGGIYNEGSLTVEDTLVEANIAWGFGGGLFNHASGVVTLYSVTFSENQTIEAGFLYDSGGGLMNQGEAHVYDSTFVGNQADDAGGGIASWGTTLEIVDSSVLQNIARIAAGIESNDSGELTLRGVQVAGNLATAGDGGGVFQRGSGAGLILETTVSGNTASAAGGGIASDGQLTIMDSLLQDNHAQDGGGIASRGPLTLEHSTVRNNQAFNDGGGGWLGGPSTFVIASTVSGNMAGAGGGGLYVFLQAEIENSTISGNTAAANGGGIHAINYGVDVRNSTLAGNAAAQGSSLYSLTHFELRYTILVPASGMNCVVGPSFGGGGNLDSDGSCGYPDENGMNGLDPLLASLADNGGPTFTHALMPGSPALDAIPLGFPPGCPIAADQRGVARPQGAGCDLGSYEAEGPLVVTLQPLPTPTPGPTAAPFQPLVSGEADANCRSGPGTLYPAVGALRQGQQAPADGRNPDASWLRVRLDNGLSCWVWVGSVSVAGDPAGLPLLPAPPLPTPTFTASPPSTPTRTFTPTTTAIP